MMNYFFLARFYMYICIYLFNFCYSLYILKLSRYFTLTNILSNFSFSKVLSAIFFQKNKYKDHFSFNKQPNHISVIHTKSHNSYGESHYACFYYLQSLVFRPYFFVCPNLWLPYNSNDNFGPPIPVSN